MKILAIALFFINIFCENVWITVRVKCLQFFHYFFPSCYQLIDWTVQYLECFCLISLFQMWFWLWVGKLFIPLWFDSLCLYKWFLCHTEIYIKGYKIYLQTWSRGKYLILKRNTWKLFLAWNEMCLSNL